jgi:hypothetical protein
MRCTYTLYAQTAEGAARSGYRRGIAENQIGQRATELAVGNHAGYASLPGRPEPFDIEVRAEGENGHPNCHCATHVIPIDREVKINDPEAGALVAILEMPGKGRHILRNGDRVSQVTKRSANPHPEEEILAQYGNQAPRARWTFVGPAAGPSLDGDIPIGDHMVSCGDSKKIKPP